VKLFPVEKRNKVTLLKLIADNVKQGSTIYIDGWAAYKSLNDMGFRHFVVEHKHAFKTSYVNEQTGEIEVVHTNTIEGAWKHAKEHVRRINGTKVTNFERHLMEIMYRNWNRDKLVPGILKLVRDITPWTSQSH